MAKGPNRQVYAVIDPAQGRGIIYDPRKLLSEEIPSPAKEMHDMFFANSATSLIAVFESRQQSMYAPLRSMAKGLEIYCDNWIEETIWTFTFRKEKSERMLPSLRKKLGT